MTETHLCPHCQRGELLEGPHGGSSVNLRCSNPGCNHEFFVGIANGQAWIGERIYRNLPDLYHGVFNWE